MIQQYCVERRRKSKTKGRKAFNETIACDVFRCLSLSYKIFKYFWSYNFSTVEYLRIEDTILEVFATH